MPPVDRLRRRVEFKAAASGRRAHNALLTLQALSRGDAAGKVRIGFTVTRKTGGAVERNRIRRRLRAAVADIVPEMGRAGHDYVIVARRGLLTAPFDRIRASLADAFRRVHGHAAPIHAPGREAEELK